MTGTLPEKKQVWNEPMLFPAIGIAGGVLLERIAAFAIWEAAAAGAVFGVFALVSRRPILRRLCLLLFGTGVGVVSALWHKPGPPPRIDASAQETVIVSGCVVEPSVFAENREQFTLELAPSARARVSLNLREGQMPPRLRYGQQVEMEGRVRAPHNFGNPGAFDFASYLARRNIYWNVSTRTGAEVNVLPGECGSKIEGWLYSLRAEALERLERLYAGDTYKSIMMQAVLIGENTRLERSWTEHFRKTGTYHALVISGLHLTVLAGYLLILFRYTTGRHGLSLFLALIAAWIYAAASGMSAPVGRAAGGFTLFLLSRFWFRPTHVLNALSVVVSVFLLFDPGQLFEGSFQLSVLSVLAIGALADPVFEVFTRPVSSAFRQLDAEAYDVELDWRISSLRVELRLLSQTLAAWTRLSDKTWYAITGSAGQTFFYLYEIFMLSAVVQVALALPMAVYFHRVSLSGMAANVFIVPLMNGVVVIGFVAILTNWTLFAAIAGWLLEVSRAVAEFFSALEPGWRIPDPPLWLALSFTAALIFLALTARHRTPLRLLASAAVWILFAIVVMHPFAARREEGQMELTAIDVGQGDSILLVTPQGRTLLMDAGGVPAFKGRPKPKLDIGEDVVSSYLWTRSMKKIDVLALTHAHEDHSGGLAALMANFRPSELWVGAMGESPVWQRVRASAAANGVRIVSRTAGEQVDFGGIRLRVLAPYGDYAPTEVARNNDSLVLMAEYGERRFLLTGDAEKEIEFRMAGEPDLPRADVLKLGHHGSRTSTTAELLDALQPSFAIVSAGFDNLYRHPHPDVLRRLQQRGIVVYRTDHQGQVRILTDGHRMEITSFTPR
jgi:competence protein ComEC